MAALTLLGPYPPLRGGIAGHTALLADALAKRGHAVQRISYRRLYPSLLYPGRGQTDPASAEDPAQRLVDALNPLSWPAAVEEITRRRPAALILPWWTPFLAPLYAYLAARLPVVYLIHNVLPHEPRRTDAPLARLALNRGRGFITQAAAEKQRLAALLPGCPPASAAQVCPHPLPGAPNLPPREAARARLGLPADQPAALFLGLVRPYKGLDVLVEALGLLRAAGRPRPYVLAAGECWGRAASALRSRIDALGVEDCIRLEDRYIPAAELPVYLAAADFFTAPYRAASQSGAVKLAMSCGLPLICTPPVIDPLVANWPALQPVPTGDALALAEALAAWAQQPPARLPLPNPAPGWDALARAVEGTAGL